MKDFFDRVRDLEKEVKRIKCSLCNVDGSSSLLRGAVMSGSIGMNEEIFAYLNEDASHYGYIEGSWMLVDHREFGSSNLVDSNTNDPGRMSFNAGSKVFIFPRDWQTTIYQETSDLASFTIRTTPHYWTQWAEVAGWNNPVTNEFIITPNSTLSVPALSYYSSNGWHTVTDFSSLNWDTSNPTDWLSTQPVTSDDYIAISNGIPILFWDNAAAPDGAGWYYWENNTWNFSGTTTAPHGEGIFTLSNGELCFRNRNVTTNALVSSDDGRTWTSVTLPTASSPAFKFLEWIGDKYVYVGDANTIYTTTDLSVFTSRTSAFGGATNMLSIYYTGGLAVVTRNAASTSVIFSEDGITWTASAATPNAQWIYAAFIDGFFVIASTAAASTVATSVTLASAFSTVTTSLGITANPNRGSCVAVLGTDKIIFTGSISSLGETLIYDGAAWTHYTDGVPVENLAYLDTISKPAILFLNP